MFVFFVDHLRPSKDASCLVYSLNASLIEFGFVMLTPHFSPSQRAYSYICAYLCWWLNYHRFLWHTNFSLDDALELVSYFIGIDVAHCKKGIFLYQHKYTLDPLCRHKIKGSKEIGTPISTKFASSLVSIDATECRSAIRGLHYLTVTRLDIAFAVNKFTQHMSSPMAEN